MNHTLSFGKHIGKTYEWLFFKAPSYTQWIYDERIYRQDYNFDEEEAAHFLELYHRASNLAGTCCQCKQRAVTRMGLTTHRTGDLGAVGFYCDQCEYQGGSRTGYYQPSLLVEAYSLEPCEQRMIVNEIRRHYIGYGNLTQRRMEAFFHDDANFSNRVPDYFTPEEVKR
jgi:hypothetical protein